MNGPSQPEPSQPEPLLAVSALRCERDGRVLFSDLSLTLGAGAFCELVGPNGSGKSTLLRCIAGLYRQYDGAVAASALLYYGHRAASAARLTPLENLRWLLALEGAEATADAALEGALETVGLGAYVEDPCDQLSAGQRRRVGLARLVLTERRLWLLDEPQTALDRAGSALLEDLLTKHRAGGGAVLCATHQAIELPDKQQLALGAEAAGR